MDNIYKLAIVGSSRAPDSAYDFVKDTIKRFIPLTAQVQIVSGGASGIDSLAERVAKELNLPIRIFKPKINDWLAVGGFRDRNIEIAKYADMIISMPLEFNGKECYHCHTKSHDKTAGCWTANYAKSIGKVMAIAVVPKIYVKEIMQNVDTQYSAEFIDHLPSNNIFVFGSNLAGRHGAGSAKIALEKFGARYGFGFGVGLVGQSYAIPTKDHHIETLPLQRIEMYVCEFLEFARSRKDLTFHVTAIGCGLAGYTPEQIAPMFRGYPDNVKIPKIFAPYI